MMPKVAASYIFKSSLLSSFRYHTLSDALPHW